MKSKHYGYILLVALVAFVLITVSFEIPVRPEIKYPVLLIGGSLASKFFTWEKPPEKSD